MTTQQKFAIGGAILGGIAATQGESGNILDIALGAAIMAAIGFGIGAIVAGRQKKTGH